MGSAEKERRRKERKTCPVPKIVRVDIKDRLGHARWITANLIDYSESGVQIELTAPLQAGTVLPFRGRVSDQRDEVLVSARVAWCLERTTGMFRAGLEFRTPNGKFANLGQQRSEATDDGELDHYEIMQLSPNADPDTIHRVYRLLAQRYHPDHTETGDRETFITLTEAYQVLSDPERRAAYDARYQVLKRLRWKIFDQARTASGVEAEKRKRLGILGILYANMINNPEQPGITIREFEDRLGCPREHLQVSLWYLKTKGYIQRTDNGRYSISVEGFEHAEQHCVWPEPSERLLPEPDEP